MGSPRADETCIRWAWQNTHLTRHIPVDDRITEARTRIKTSAKTGLTRKRIVRPPLNLTDKLANLHLLLRADSFCRWPLDVRFFNEDVYDLWQRWCDRVDERIRDSVVVHLDFKEPEIKSRTDGQTEDDMPMNPKPRPQGVEGLDVGFSPLRDHLKKSIDLLEAGNVSCAICSSRLPEGQDCGATCPHPSCRAVSHLSCLSSAFLLGEAEDVIVPVSGHCPGCNAQVRWIDVVKELSLRTRGGKDLEKILREPRKKKAPLEKKSRKKAGKDGDISKATDKSPVVVSESDTVSDPMEELDVEGMEMQYVDDDWRPQDTDDDNISVTSAFSVVSDHPMKDAQFRGAGRNLDDPLAVVVEDSEWDDAEVLD